MEKINTSAERFRWSSSDQKTNGLPFAREDSASKIASEEEDIGDPDLRKSSFNQSSFQFEGVRFSPKVIEFIDAFEGKQFAVNITIQNVGEKPALIKIGEPNSFIFQLKKPSRRIKFLASGSYITKTITYSYHNDDLVQRSQIPIQINGRSIDYPIIVKKAAPEIEVNPNQLDFKQINLGASAKTLLLTIHNLGGKRTKFEIDLGKNDLDLVVNPIRGTIKAKSQVEVVVEMMGVCEGDYFKELWVTTNEMSTRVPILVEVVKPRLEIIHQNVTEDFVLIDFSPTFVKTQRAESFLLKNYSADTTLFITLAETGGDLQFLKDARKVHETCRMFMLTAEEGRLEPFESRVLTVLFQPKRSTHKIGWKHREKNKKKKTRWEHILFVRINRVHCIEIKELAKVEAKPLQNTVKERNSSTVQSTISLLPVFSGPSRNPRAPPFLSEMSEINNRFRKSSGFLVSSSLEEKVLRLCLHGTAVEPVIEVQPTSFEFEPIKVGKTENKVLRITNGSIVEVKYQFRKMMNIDVRPNSGWLQPDEALEVLICLTPTCAGAFKTRIQIEIMAKSDVVLENDKDLITITSLFVPVTYVAGIVPTRLQAKLGFGITPLLTDEVGITKELATFKSDCPKPQVAMLSSLTRKMRPEWMKKECDKIQMVDNAIIAFPNDRPRKYYTWAKENICRTIFKGFFRYSPPEDKCYTFTPKEMERKKRQYLLWNNYLKILRETRLRKLVDPGTDYKEYDVQCDKKMESYNPKSMCLNDTKPVLDLQLLTSKKDAQPRHDLVPLSPQHLNNINVEPKLINFGTVAFNTLVHETLTIFNMNPFPVGMRFMPGKAAVTVMEGTTIIIQPFFTKTLPVSFQTKDLGRHYGFLNYIINGSHQFKITISAYVTPKTLMLEDKNLVIEFGNCPPEYAFQSRTTFLELGNLLQSPIKYRWELPADSAFTTDIIEGEVPPRTQLLTEIKFALQPGVPFYSELNLISESGTSELIKLIYPIKKVPVGFLMSRIHVHDIPLNLPTKVTPVIQNACYHEVVFVVLNRNPMPGVVVEPREAVLKPRSFFPLEIQIQIPVVMKFSFEVVIFVHIYHRISVKITGQVVVPVIRIKPTEVVMRKICSQSFDTVALCIENAGTTPAEIDIDFQGCPEYEVEENKSHIYLPPSKLSKLKIRFQPKDVARYVFYLPIIINRILGPPLMQEPNTENLGFYISPYESIYEGFGKVFRSENFKMKLPCACINSTVSTSLLTISPSNVNFQSTKNPDSEFQAQSITICNEYAENVTFCIRNDDLGAENKSPFNLVPQDTTAVEMRTKSMKAQLKQGEQLTLDATFTPKRPGTYQIDVPIFVKDYSDGIVYNYIKLKGELKQPLLCPDSNEIHFPPLPLHIGCDVFISIQAQNYKSHSNISCVIWNPESGESNSEYLSVTWMNDPKISPIKEVQVFQAQVNFCSPIPIALRNYVIFIDSMGNYCTVLVTAVSDNSAVTTHAFLATRASKYKLVRDGPSPWRTNTHSEMEVPRSPKSGEGKNGSKSIKKVFYKKTLGFYNDQVQGSTLPIDKGSRLVIQVTKSMSKPTQLGFVNPTKNSVFFKNKECSSTYLVLAKGRGLNSFSQSDSTSAALSNDRICKEPGMDVTHPNFPTQDTLYGKHFRECLAFAERWIYEVVMRCDQYFVIPRGFQKLRNGANSEKPAVQTPKKNKNSGKGKVEKDFMDFLEEIVSPELKEILPKRPTYDEHNRVKQLYYFYLNVLKFLSDQGCLFPHIRPEYLLTYEDYVILSKEQDFSETFKWSNTEIQKRHFNSKVPKEVSLSTPRVNVDNETSFSSSSIFNRKQSWRKSLFDDLKSESDDHLYEGEVEGERYEEAEKSDGHWHPAEGRQFVHKVDILDKATMEARSTQAWFDVIIQIFRSLFLTKVHFVPTIPEVETLGSDEKICVDSFDVKSHAQSQFCDRNVPVSLESNLYTIQERALLMWLNHHYNEQKNVFCKEHCNENPCLSSKLINNFDKDLADSIALILVTAAHCPYVVPEYFSDIFFKPDSQNKLFHNAGKLTLVWKTLNLGLTVESADIVNPNSVFMIMLVTQLYRVLPTLHPHYRIYFSASLSTESTRTIQIKNESHESVIYQVKFLGEYEGFYRLKSSSSLIHVKPLATTEVNVIFTARKIKKALATLVFCGYVVSPNFAQHFSFYLDGEPSDLRECAKLTFSTPLYKVLCTEIPVSPPYVGPTTYEVWYTTNKPIYKEGADISVFIKPWSKIWNRKVSRRLFLNKCEINIKEGEKTVGLGVTVACMTEEDRDFWLLFRSSKIGDFILWVHTKVNTKMPLTSMTAFLPDTRSPSSQCLCPDSGKNLKSTSTVMGCPFLTEVNIPVRNDALWDALRNMLLRTLHSQEKSFWAKHFEKNIGICLILWFINAEEEEAVADEFVHVLQTRVLYSLKIEPPHHKYLTIPDRVEIADVRKNGEIKLPMHVSKNAPQKLKAVLTMTSENGKEIRRFKIILAASNPQNNARPNPEIVEENNLKSAVP